MSLLPIYVCWDSGMKRFETDAIFEALREIKTMFPQRKIVVYGSKAWSDGDYSSADWYICRSRKIARSWNRSQIDADSIVRLLAKEPWQKYDEHIDLLFTSKDLTARNGISYLNFCFGISSGRFIVQSVYRFRSLNFRDLSVAIKGLVWHELGHTLGAASNLDRRYTEFNLGPHCTMPGCVMRQGLTVEAFVEHAKEAMETTSKRRAPRIYCPLCREDIKRSPI